MERGSGSEGRRRGSGQHMKCADRQMEELMEDKQTLCSHSVRHLRQAQADSGRGLTDLNMSGISGTELATEIRKQRPSLPVVIMSGSFAQLGAIPKPSGCLSIDKPFRMG
jgi:FixJ family two-component response regulator